MTGRVVGVAIGAFILAMTGVALASTQPSGRAAETGPDPEDCEDLLDQLASQTSARNDMQNQRAALLAAAQQMPIGTDEKLLFQVAQLDGMIAQVNADIAATNAQLQECQ